ncbi:hypothetical protein GQ53DRAFT_883129 [Thozetella sp. PMI_491]|nr:hypothetical protein GQ53DRAFT_883129 [Thozetella sp. PMI_491]
MSMRRCSHSLPRPSALALLTSALAVGSLFLFLRFAYEPDLTVRLHPEEHQWRENTSLHFDWVITKGYRYPDGVGKWVYLINGNFPAPNIEARSGDLVTIDVHNRLEDEGIALHFHGLHMRGSNHMDGVVGVTQRPIQAGEDFTYSFAIGSDQSGTFWWHSHYDVQRADGLFGGFIIHEPRDSYSPRQTPLYEDDLLLLIGDWYHPTAVEIQKTYDTYQYWGMEPVPDSLLINGHGAFNCSKASKSKPLDCMTVPSPQLIPTHGKSRLRTINVGAMSGFSFQTPGRSLTLFTTDGGNPIQAPSSGASGFGVLYPGERVDVIVDWRAFSGARAVEHFEIILDRENYKKKNLALTPNQRFPVVRMDGASAESTAPREPQDAALIDLSTINGPELPHGTLPVTPGQIVLLYTRVELLSHLGNAPKGFINRTYWEPQEVPLIEAERQNWDKHQLAPDLPTALGWVDIVVNNVDEKGHPFHLHGYDFYVVSLFRPKRRGWFSYNPFDPKKKQAGGKYNLVNPPRKDTIYIAGGGYAVLRIKVDNPGVWFFHCHILWHQAIGMAMAIHVTE